MHPDFLAPASAPGPIVFNHCGLLFACSNPQWRLEFLQLLTKDDWPCDHAQASCEPAARRGLQSDSSIESAV